MVGFAVVHPATITQITSSGFTARLLDYGIDGAVDLRKDPEKFSFDRWAARLSSPTRAFQLEQQLTIRIEKVDCAKKEIVFVPVAAPAPDSAPEPAPPAESSL